MSDEWVEWRAEDHQTGAEQIAGRIVHAFWPMLRLTLRQVLLDPHRRASGGTVGWRWRAPRQSSLPDNVALADLRRRIGNAMVDLAADAELSDRSIAGTSAGEVHGGMEALLQEFMSMSDSRLASYAVRTQMGWMIRSWGFSSPAPARVLEENVNESDNDESHADVDAAPGPAKERTSRRRLKTWHISLFLVLLGAAGFIAWYVYGRSDEPKSAAPRVQGEATTLAQARHDGVVPDSGSTTSGTALGASAGNVTGVASGKLHRNRKTGGREWPLAPDGASSRRVTSETGALPSARGQGAATKTGPQRFIEVSAVVEQEPVAEAMTDELESGPKVTTVGVEDEATEEGSEPDGDAQNPESGGSSSSGNGGAGLHSTGGGQGGSASAGASKSSASARNTGNSSSAQGPPGSAGKSVSPPGTGDPTAKNPEGKTKSNATGRGDNSQSGDSAISSDKTDATPASKKSGQQKSVDEAEESSAENWALRWEKTEVAPTQSAGKTPADLASGAVSATEPEAADSTTTETMDIDGESAVDAELAAERDDDVADTFEDNSAEVEDTIRAESAQVSSASGAIGLKPHVESTHEPKALRLTYRLSKWHEVQVRDVVLSTWPSEQSGEQTVAEALARAKAMTEAQKPMLFQQPQTSTGWQFELAPESLKAGPPRWISEAGDAAVVTWMIEANRAGLSWEGDMPATDVDARLVSAGGQELGRILIKVAKREIEVFATSDVVEVAPRLAVNRSNQREMAVYRWRSLPGPRQVTRWEAWSNDDEIGVICHAPDDAVFAPGRDRIALVHDESGWALMRSLKCEVVLP